MKNAIIFLLYIVSFSVVVNANTNYYNKSKLAGKVTDKETGEAIIGATIYIPDLKTGAAADTSGNYLIDNLPSSKILVQVSYIGYKTIIRNIDLSIILNCDFSMEQAIEEMNAVVVTGSSRVSEIKRSPSPIVALESKSLAENLNTNIIDAIAKMPGINAVTTGPNVSKPYIHGLGYNRILTLFDGIRQEGQQWGDEHGIEVDENSVDRIEVVKGPASLIYGSDALAGVVNLLPAQIVPDGTMKGAILTNYQSNNRLYEGSFSLAGNKKGLVWGGRISHKQATNYQNKIDGRVYGTAFNESDLNGFVGLNKSWGYSHLKFSVYDNLQEIPDGSRDSTTRKFTKQITEADTLRLIVPNSELNSYKIAALHQHVQHYRLYSSNNFIIGSGKLAVTLGLQQNVRREFSHPEDEYIPGLYLVLNTFTYDFKYHLPDMSGWEPAIGLNGMYQTNANKGTEFLIPDYNQFDIGPFVFIKKSFSEFDVSAGLRYDKRIFKNDEMLTRPNPKNGYDMQVGLQDTIGAYHAFNNFKNTISGYSGSIGLTYNLAKEFLIKGNVARGFRAPNVLEISANGVHPGTLIYQVGNPVFKPEFSLQEDLTLFYSSYHINGSIGVFNNNISNYIFNQKLINHLGKDSIVVRGNHTFKFQQSQAQLYGGEADLDIHPHPLDWLHFENSISLVYGFNKGGNGVTVSDSSKYSPFIPPLHTNSELRAGMKKAFKHFSSPYAKIGMEYYAKQDRAYLTDGTETPTPGYTLFNCGFGADVTNNKGKILFSFHILGNNITDVAFQSHLSRLKYFEQFPVNWSGHSGIYNMGRNIGFKIIVPIG
jgi:iron complex outermembrane receptor protein